MLTGRKMLSGGNGIRCTGIRTPSISPDLQMPRYWVTQRKCYFCSSIISVSFVSVINYKGKNNLKKNRVWGARSLRVWSTVTGESKLQEMKQQATGHVIHMPWIDSQLFTVGQLAFMQSKIQTQKTVLLFLMVFVHSVTLVRVTPLRHDQKRISCVTLHTVKLAIVIATVLKDKL